jgi:hypothetical protein
MLRSAQYVVYELLVPRCIQLSGLFAGQLLEFFFAAQASSRSWSVFS